MDQTYVDIMIQSLQKKERVLLCIIDANARQKAGLENPELTPDEFDEIVEEKSDLIEQIVQLDSGFEKLYERVKAELDGNREMYADQILQMQELIKSITDKSMQIQSQEARNKDLMMRKFNAVKSQVKEVRTNTKAANQYYKNMMKVNLVDPQFMDHKK